MFVAFTSKLKDSAILTAETVQLLVDENSIYSTW